MVKCLLPYFVLGVRASPAEPANDPRMSTPTQETDADATSSNTDPTSSDNVASDQHARRETCAACGARLGFTTTADDTTVLTCPGCGRAPTREVARHE